MPNVIASATTVSNGTIKRNNFLIGVDTSVQYGPTSATTFWNGIVPSASGYTVYEQKSQQGPSIRTASNDSELITIAKQCGGTNITTIYDALSYFNSQSNYLVTNIDYPNIVTSGLTLMLDAGYIPSYPTTGTTWNDMSGGGNTGTLTNGPTFSSANGGSIVFDGTNQYGNTLTNNFAVGSNSKSLQVWFKQNVSGTVDVICGYGTSVTAQFFGLYYDASNRIVFWGYNSADYVTSYIISTNVWYNVAITYISPTVYIYVNGVLIGQNNYTANTGTAYSMIGANTTGGPSNYLHGSISNIQIYNRALSTSEILQNYNATKSRFGL